MLIFHLVFFLVPRFFDFAFQTQQVDVVFEQKYLLVFYQFFVLFFLKHLVFFVEQTHSLQFQLALHKKRPFLVVIGTFHDSIVLVLKQLQLFYQQILVRMLILPGLCEQDLILSKHYEHFVNH